MTSKATAVMSKIVADRSGLGFPGATSGRKCQKIEVIEIRASQVEPNPIRVPDAILDARVGYGEVIYVDPTSIG